MGEKEKTVLTNKCTVCYAQRPHPERHFCVPPARAVAATLLEELDSGVRIKVARVVKKPGEAAGSNNDSNGVDIGGTAASKALTCLTI